MNKALFNLPVLTAAAFSLAATVVIVAMVFAEKPEPPSLMFDVAIGDEPLVVPEFEVTGHDGQVITRQSMLGKVWVCDFFLTRCNGVCPILGRTMADLADDLSKDAQLDEVKLVSFSVDPEHDTVDKLKQYRKINMGVWDRGSEARQDEINRRWIHTRAAEQEVFWELVRDGFKLDVGPSKNDPKTPIAHSSKLVLIDQQGNIRGYYDGLTDAEQPHLLADIHRLMDETD